MARIRRTRNIKRAADAVQSKAAPHLSTKTDWKATFLAFCRDHGPYPPIDFKGKLLFHDGWQYSSTSYRGPSWPPPKDIHKRHKLQLAYYKVRRAAVRESLYYLELDITRLVEACKAISGKVHVVNMLKNESGERIGDPTVPVDLDGLLARRDGLRADLADCESKIKEYTHDAEPTNGRHQ